MSSEEQPKQNLADGLSAGLQSQIMDFAAEVRKYNDNDYIGHCEFCQKRVDRSEMIYKLGHLLHQSCSDQHIGEFQLEAELVNEYRRKRVDEAYLKNLAFRIANKQIKKSSISTKKKKTPAKKRKTKRKPVKKKKTKTKGKKVTKRKLTTKRKKNNQAKKN